MTDPPSNVTMTGPEVVGSGSSVTFTCNTSPANPAANVTWTIHGKASKNGAGVAVTAFFYSID